jgi:hypothetical protein
VDLSKFIDASLEDLMDNPASFGAPSFEEFSRDPDRFRNRQDHLLAIADDGSKLEGLKKRLGVIRWEIDDYKMDNPEQIERYCKDEGIDMLNDLELKPFLVEGVSGKIDLVNRYSRKSKILGV